VKDPRPVFLSFIPKEQWRVYQFLGERLRQGVDERRALIDLVQSDVPLDPTTRRLIARDLEEHYFSSTKRVLNRRRNAMRENLYNAVKTALQRDGWKALDAEYRAAVAVGKNVDAIRKQIQRARKKKRAK
jgi:hypothetical protein